MNPEPLVCAICGDSRDVRIALAWYIEGGVASIPRCVDRDACRSRVDYWPLEMAAEARRRAVAW